MSLRNLITGETVDIDNHNRGIDLDIDDRSIHIHKRFNSANKRFAKSEATFDLNSNNKKITIRKKKGPDANIIENEIQKAFKNGQLRKDFVDDLIDQLQNLAKFARNTNYYNIDNNTGERSLTKTGVDKILEIVTRVYDYFRGPNDELRSYHYYPDTGFIARFGTRIKSSKSKVSNRNSDFINTETSQYITRHHYILANIDDISFSLSDSRKDLLDRFGEDEA